MLNSSVYKGGSEVSPDGRWIAYHSTESGRSEVYVRSFPALDQKHQISNGGGTQPLWSTGGRELFYLTLNAKLMAVDVGSAASLEISNPKQLFQTPIEGNPALSQYAVASAGQRFLMIANARDGAASGIEEFHLIINLFSELKTNRY